MTGEDRFLLKNMIDVPSVTALFESVAAIDASFDVARALSQVFNDSFQALELKQRIRLVARVLRTNLAGTYREALAHLVTAAPAARATGFTAMALNDFVEEFGTDDFDASMPALAVFTRVVSAEFAVRPFLVKEVDRTLDVMRQWADDDEPALRRLASEGSRPRLPWGMGIPALKVDPSLTRSILETLRHDPSEDVRRSVANHLNDIAKDHPAYVVSLLEDWQDGTPEVTAITRHGLRTLLKKGDSDALRLLGFEHQPDVAVADLRVDPAAVPIGGTARAHWSVTNNSPEPVRLMVDYAVEYHRAERAASRRVFKGSVLELGPGQSVDQSRKLTLAQMSTRRIEAGPHVVEVQINGTVAGRTVFAVN